MANETRNHSESRSYRETVRMVRRRLNRAVWLNVCLSRLGLALGAYAVVEVVLKLVWPAGRAWGHIFLAAVPVVLVWGYLHSRRGNRFFTDAQAVETLDHLYRNDGSLCTLGEAPEVVGDAALAERAASELARCLPRLRPAYAARRLAPAVVYLAVALALPPRPAPPAAQAREVAAVITQPLLDKLAENAQLLPQAQVEELRREVEEMAQDPRGLSREQWEAVEELEHRINDAANQGQSELASLTAQIEEMGRRMGETGGTPDANSPESKARQSLAQDIQKALEKPSSGLSDQLKNQLKQMAGKAGSGQCSAGDLQKQLDALRQGACKGGMQAPELTPTEGDGSAGSGGIDRGRGDAALVMGEEKGVKDATFDRKEVANQFLDPESLIDLGITPLKPRVDPGQFSPGVVREFDAQSGPGVSRAYVAPGQKDVVSRYFSK